MRNYLSGQIFYLWYWQYLGNTSVLLTLVSQWEHNVQVYHTVIRASDTVCEECQYRFSWNPLFCFQTMSSTLDNLTRDEDAYVELIEEKKVRSHCWETRGVHCVYWRLGRISMFNVMYQICGEWRADKILSPHKSLMSWQNYGTFF